MTQLLDYWKSGQQCTLIEVITQGTASQELLLTEDTTQDVQGVPEITEEDLSQVSQGAAEDITQDTEALTENKMENEVFGLPIERRDDSTREDQEQGPSMLGATLPTAQRKRGRPKGSCLSAIGLPKQKKTETWRCAFLQRGFQDQAKTHVGLAGRSRHNRRCLGRKSHR